MDTRSHFVYLLTSLDENFEGAFYIGYTVDPLRRLRQHNGELVSGAKQTSRRGRPWTLVCCLSGFPESHLALKFEWSWQHPLQSSKLRPLCCTPSFTRLQRLDRAVATLYYLVRCSPFHRLHLCLHIFDGDRFHHTAEKIRLALGLAPFVPDAHPDGEDANAEVVALSLGSQPNNVFDASTPYLRKLVTTREVFQSTYLCPDACLSLGGEARVGRALADVGCPYDVEALAEVVSQASVATYSNAVTHRPHGAAANDPPGTTTDGVFRVPRRLWNHGAHEFVEDYRHEMALLEQKKLPCTLCALPLRWPYVLRCPRTPLCEMRAHVACLAMWMHSQDTNPRSTTPVTEEAGCVMLLPQHSCPCPLCGENMHWAGMVRAVKQRAVADGRLQAHRRWERLQAVCHERLVAVEDSHRKRARAKRTTRRCRGRPSIDLILDQSNRVIATHLQLSTSISNAPVCESPVSSIGSSALLQVTDINLSEWLER